MRSRSARRFLPRLPCARLTAGDRNRRTQGSRHNIIVVELTAPGVGFSKLRVASSPSPAARLGRLEIVGVVEALSDQAVDTNLAEVVEEGADLIGGAVDIVGVLVEQS